MRLHISPDSKAMSRAAALHAAASIREAIAATGSARIVVATGASQLEFLARLTAMPDLAWPRVELFHLDEYVGLHVEHPASFRRYLREHVVDKTTIGRVHLLEVDGHDPADVCRRVGHALTERTVDVAFVGIGENAHLAFNDPPADFEAAEPYRVVTLDHACRAQQVGEGWFTSIEEVPQTAVSMSIRQILTAREIVAVVPDARKAAAVKASLEGVIGPAIPASALRLHPNVTLFLDEASASLLSPETHERAGM